MAGGFSVAIGSDTRIFEQGVRTGVIEPVEDAQEALQDLARTGSKAGDSARDLERVGKAADQVENASRDAERAMKRLGDSGEQAADGVTDGARKAERELDKVGAAGKEAGNDLEHSLRDAQQQTGKTAAEYREMAEEIRSETAKIKASSKEGFDGAGKSSGEFKDEALSNFSEVTSSFQGDMSSITDLAQGTFGGLATMGGPASLVFGGLAVAVGLVGSALTQSGEDTEEFKEKIKELADTKLSDLFGKYEDSGDDLARGLRAWGTDADSFGGSLTDLQKNARDAKLPFGDLASAIGTQSVPRMKEMRREVEASIKSLDEQAASQRGAGNGMSALSKKYGEQADAARAVKKQLDDNLAVNDQYEESLKAVAQAQGQTVEQYKKSLDAAQAEQDAQEAAKEAEKQRLDERKAQLEQYQATVDSVYSAAAESESEAIDNGAINADRYAEGLEKRTAAAQQFEANIAAIGQQLPADLFDFVRDQGPGFSEEIATYLAASPAQKERIQAAWTIDAQVKADTSDVDKKTAEKGKETKPGPTSEVKGDTKDIDKKVDEQGKKKVDGPTLRLRADDSDVEKAISGMRNKRFDGPTAVFGVDRSSVNAAISDLRQTQINIRVKAVDG